MSKNRFANHTIFELQEANHSPIFGYEDSPILTLEEAVEKLIPLVPGVLAYVMTALRAEDRHALIPWFAYLKLFMTALNKLLPIKAVVWRGVYGDVSSVFANNNIEVWWSVNSTSSDLEIVQPFLGEHGTLFTIEAKCGKDISQFAANPDEKEVILMPGTCVRAKTEVLNFNDRLFVVHLDEITPQ
ncbi:unnamed protein product, partial [Adineta steineri]